MGPRLAGGLLLAGLPVGGLLPGADGLPVGGLLL